jgi:hypothetical protein
VMVIGSMFSELGGRILKFVRSLRSLRSLKCVRCVKVVWSRKVDVALQKEAAEQERARQSGQAERHRDAQRFHVGTCMAARDEVAATSIRK